MHGKALSVRKGDFTFGPVDIEVRERSFTAVMGQVGSGKTTLLELLSGITSPGSGRLERTGSVGIVFQHPEVQLFAETVFADISYGIRDRVKDRKEQERLVRETMSRIGLSTDLIWKSPFELSGGEQRKAAIAGILITDPDILLLDEPLSGMSGKARDSLMESILGMRREGKGIVMVTHDPEAAAAADRLLVMKDGKKVWDGEPRPVLSSVEKAESLGIEPTSAARTARLAGLPPCMTEDDIVKALREAVK